MNRMSAAALAAVGLLMAAPAPAAPAPLEALIKEIKVALLAVQNEPDAASLPPLKSATLNATTVQTKVSGASFKLFVIEFGRKRTSDLTTEVSITLTPPSATDAPGIARPNVGTSLAGAILSAARAVRAARDGPPPLVASEVKASIKFGVSQDSNGTIVFTIVPVTIGGGGSQLSSTTQEIVVTYESD